MLLGRVRMKRVLKGERDKNGEGKKGAESGREMES